MSTETQLEQEIVLTATTGTNADLLPSIFRLYVPEGSRVADVTYGRGVFWQQIDQTKYEMLTTDLMTGVDFCDLPYEGQSIDALIFDPPYMHGGGKVGGKGIKESINRCYRNANTSHESVVRLYAGGILESARVLRKRGVIIVKCQDEIESGKQRLSHVEIIQLLELLGFEVVDQFVLVQETVPTMRHNYQKSARKNHSHAIVARFRR